MLAELAVAQEEVLLAWTAPAECPSLTDVRTRIAELAGNAEVLRATFRARGAVSAPTHTSARWTARIDFLAAPDASPSRTRLLEADGCKTLSEAAALMVAFALNPNAGLAAPPAPPEPERGVLLPPSAPWRLRVGSGVLADSRLPAARVGTEWSLGLEHSGWSVALAAQAGARVDARYASPSDLGASFGMQSALIRAGASVARLGVIEIVPTAAVAWDRTYASGFGADANDQDTRDRFSLQGGSQVRIKLLPALEAHVAAYGIAPLRRRTYVVEGLGPLHTTAPFAWQLALGFTFLLATQK